MPRLSGQAAFPKEIAGSQKCDHGFLALLGDDGLLDLAALNVDIANAGFGLDSGIRGAESNALTSTASSTLSLQQNRTEWAWGRRCRREQSCNKWSLSYKFPFGS